MNAGFQDAIRHRYAKKIAKPLTYAEQEQLPVLQDAPKSAFNWGKRGATYGSLLGIIPLLVAVLGKQPDAAALTLPAAGYGALLGFSAGTGLGALKNYDAAKRAELVLANREFQKQNNKNITK